MTYHRVAQFRTAAQFQQHLTSIGADLPFDAVLETGETAPLAQPLTYGAKRLANRFAVLPMEGWDGTKDGFPTDLTRRRWARFGQSGASLIWGGEAVAVRHDGRANPNQLLLNEATLGSIAGLRETLLNSHRAHYDADSSNLLIGLQLTHSGRFSRPNEKTRLEPRIAYRHPLLDTKFKVDAGSAWLTDDAIHRLIDDFIAAGVLAQKAGYDFVDIKHCHGYLGHEFLSAIDRDGPYGGSFENRTRFLREIVAGIRAAAPELAIGVRLSAFDWIPFHPGADGTGEPESLSNQPYRYAFGGDGTGTGIDLSEPKQFLDLLLALDIRLVNITAGSPYYVPHIQRPALFPPSDGYQPPEDPLLGVARQIAVTAQLKQYRPELIFVGSGYSYLQEWLPQVAQVVVRTGMADFVGLGRMVLSYPELPADVLAGLPLQRKRICRTFSDCTTAPRHGLVSGCFPLDDFYKERDENQQLLAIKKQGKTTG
ncbi:MAG: NADH:flavin oxidoreductase [Anaerolineaceae bacterium]|nr:NADH:flavin oxidoreductase [Anaerolineaceae bacterium]